MHNIFDKRNRKQRTRKKVNKGFYCLASDFFKKAFYKVRSAMKRECQYWEEMKGRTKCWNAD